MKQHKTVPEREVSLIRHLYIFPAQYTLFAPQSGPFHGFFQLLTWTSYGKSVDTTGKSASKIVKFESDLLKTSEDIDPQSREILQTFVLWRAQTCSLSSNLKIGV